jgi:hypothetical protein
VRFGFLPIEGHGHFGFLKINGKQGCTARRQKENPMASSRKTIIRKTGPGTTTPAPSPILHDALPLPLPRFQGKIGTYYTDSAISAMSAPPADEPNVLLVLLDEVGFGHVNTFGGPEITPTLQGWLRRDLVQPTF